MITQLNDTLTGALLPSVTVTVGEKVPAAFGVPLMTPVLLLIVSPAGKPVALKVSVS